MFGRIVVFVCLSLALAVAQEKPAIRITFAPPDGAEFVQRQTEVRVATVQGEPGERRQEKETTTRYVVQRTDNGFDISSTLLAFTAKRDGNVVSDAFSALVRNQPLVYKVTAAGELTDVEGLDAVLKFASSTLPADAWEGLRKLVSKDTLVTRTAVEWNGRYARFHELEGKVGDEWHVEDNVPLLIGGEAPMTSTYTLAGRAPCAMAQCAQMKVKFGSDPKQMAEALSRVFTAMAEGLPPEKKKNMPVITEAVISGTGEMLIDPATGLLHAEKWERTLELTMSMPQQGERKVRVTDVRQSTFESKK